MFSSKFTDFHAAEGLQWVLVVPSSTQSWFHQIIFQTILSLRRVTHQRWMHMELSTAIRWCIKMYTTTLFCNTAFEKPRRNFLEGVNSPCLFLTAMKVKGRLRDNLVKKAEKHLFQPLNECSGMWKEIGHVGKSDYPTSQLLPQKTKQRLTETFIFFPNCSSRNSLT